MARGVAKGCTEPTRRVVVAAGIAVALLLLPQTPTSAAEPIKVGFSIAMTGGVAQNGKQLLIALQLWRDDVNAKGGLLGRPVELVTYDDQSNPSNVPGIYTKLISVDKVDLILGPYATNMVAAAMPVIMENNKTTISILGVAVNRHFNYSRYFSMIPVGPEGVKAFSKGYFELAAAQQPKAADIGDPRRRRRVCHNLGRRRARERRRLRIQDRLRQKLSAADHGLCADRARHPGGKPGHRVRCRLSA